MQLKKGDIILSVSILFFASALFILFLRMPSRNATAVITLDGKVKDRVALSGLATPVTIIYENMGYKNTVLAENGRICVELSTCPSQDCVHTGWISRKGQSIICMKTRLVIRIEGTDGNVDTVVS